MTHVACQNQISTAELLPLLPLLLPCSVSVVSCAGPADSAQLQAGGDAVHRAQGSRGGRGAGASGARADAGEHVHVDNEYALPPLLMLKSPLMAGCNVGQVGGSTFFCCCWGGRLNDISTITATRTEISGMILYGFSLAAGFWHHPHCHVQRNGSHVQHTGRGNARPHRARRPAPDGKPLPSDWLQ